MSFFRSAYRSNFSPRVRVRVRAGTQTRSNHVKQTFLRRLHVVSTFLVRDRRPEALVSMVILFYILGDIGAVAAPFATKLGEDTF